MAPATPLPCLHPLCPCLLSCSPQPPGFLGEPGLTPARDMCKLPSLLRCCLPSPFLLTSFRPFSERPLIINVFLHRTIQSSNSALHAHAHAHAHARTCTEASTPLGAHITHCSRQHTRTPTSPTDLLGPADMRGPRTSAAPWGALWAQVKPPSSQGAHGPPRPPSAAPRFLPPLHSLSV